MLKGEGQSAIFREQDAENLMDTVDLRKISLGIRRRFWVIILFGAIFALLSGVTTWTLMNKWQAEALILYRQDTKFQRLPGGYTLNTFSLPTVVEMIQLPTHFEAVKSILGLDLDSSDIGRMIEVEVPKRNSDIIRLLCAADNPTLAIDVCNTLASVAVKHSLDIKNKQLQVAREFYQGQLQMVQDKLSRRLEEIAAFKKENEFVEMDAGQMGSVSNLDAAEDRLRSAKVNYDSLLVEYENLRREVEKIPDHVVKLAYEDDPLKDRITQTELALLQARTRYAADNPKVKILEEELNQLRQMVAKSSFDDTREKVYEKNQLKADLNLELVRLQGKLRSAQKVKEEMEEAKARLEQEMVNLPEQQVAFARLLQQKGAAEEEVKSMSEALRSTELMMTVGKGDIELYQIADKAERYTPKLVKFLPLIGFIFGVLVGFFYLLVAEATDRRLRTAAQANLNFLPPCLQAVPELKRINRKDGEENTLFYVRAIAERLKHVVEGRPSKSIAFLSSLEGEGKSTLAYHLARYYERLGKRTVFVEFDYRPNAFCEDVAPQHSITEFLKGKISFDEAITPGKPDRLKVHFDPDLKELAVSTHMESLWGDLTKHYDKIIVETPGVVSDDYAVNVGSLADIKVFVCSARLKRRYVDNALAEMEACRVVPDGIILNRIPSTYVDDLRLKFEKRKKTPWKNWFNFSRSKKKVDNVKA